MIGRPGLPVVLVCAMSLFGGATAAEQDAPEHGVRIEHVGGWGRLDARLPGTLLSYALPRIEGGRREIVLLVRPVREDPSAPAPEEAENPADDEDGTPVVPPCPAEPDREAQALMLYRVEATAPDGLLMLHDRLPHDITAIDTVDVEGDGIDELLLAREGELFLLDADGDGEIASVLREPDLRWRSLHPRSVRAPELDGWPGVQVHAYGVLGVHGPAGAAGPWTRWASVDLPLAAHVSSRGMRIRSMKPRFIGRTPDGTLLFGTPAETHGQRLHTRMVEITSTGEAHVTDSWSRLPAPELVLEQDFVMLEGRPLLLVTTKTSEKLNIFGEKQVRLFSVEHDLSRLGRHPLFAARTRANLWQELTPAVADVNGDGTNDLVLGYWKGLKDSRVVLDVYLRSADGTFDEKPRGTAFDVDKGDRSFVEYGHDLDRDGLPDLVLRTDDGRVWLHPGQPAPTGKQLVSAKPRELPFYDEPGEAPPVEVSVSVGGTSAVRMASTNLPRFIDLDGDGHSEILLALTGRVGAARLITLSPSDRP